MPEGLLTVNEKNAARVLFQKLMILMKNRLCKQVLEVALAHEKDGPQANILPRFCDSSRCLRNRASAEAAVWRRLWDRGGIESDHVRKKRNSRDNIGTSWRMGRGELQR